MQNLNQLNSVAQIILALTPFGLGAIVCFIVYRTKSKLKAKKGNLSIELGNDPPEELSPVKDPKKQQLVNTVFDYTKMYLRNSQENINHLSNMFVTDKLGILHSQMLTSLRHKMKSEGFPDEVIGQTDDFRYLYEILRGMLFVENGVLGSKYIILSHVNIKNQSINDLIDVIFRQWGNYIEVNYVDKPYYSKTQSRTRSISKEFLLNHFFPAQREELRDLIEEVFRYTSSLSEKNDQKIEDLVNEIVSIVSL